MEVPWRELRPPAWSVCVELRPPARCAQGGNRSGERWRWRGGRAGWGARVPWGWMEADARATAH